jgi:hypothetical protein
MSGCCHIHEAGAVYTVRDVQERELCIGRVEQALDRFEDRKKTTEPEFWGEHALTFATEVEDALALWESYLIEQQAVAET